LALQPVAAGCAFAYTACCNWLCFLPYNLLQLAVLFAV